MEQRDPKNVNNYIEVNWDSIFAEPDSIRSNDCVWNCSYKCYRGTQNCCYKTLTLLFAPIIAFWMGLRFGCLAFMHIWCYAPCLRRARINYKVLRELITIILQAVCAPFIDICSLCLSRINVRYEKVPDVQQVLQQEKDLLPV